ncbi:MAG: DUF6513 domain-containing protein [Burkholderiaceae bacterium]|jgi:dihydropteroate synthase-like protein
MRQRWLFLTGRLAEASLRNVLAEIAHSDCDYEVIEIGVSVAALMTADLVRRRLPKPKEAQRILVPGRAGGDWAALSAEYGIPVVQGPDDLKDLPEFLGRGERRPDLSRHALRIFAEIVDAPHLAIDEIVSRSDRFRVSGADVIDLGCLPGMPFPHLEDSIAALRSCGHTVSVDSIREEELLRAGKAGADYLLSLKPDTLWIAEEVGSIPVVIPGKEGDLEEFYPAIEKLIAQNTKFIVDPVLNPIHFGFTESITRFYEIRRRLPEVEMLMGIGNLTELTDADTAGVTALLLGMASELSIANVLTTEVSPHARCAIRETDVARRMMFAAKKDRALPRGYTDALMALHERRPFPYAEAEIEAVAAAVRDPSFRIQVGASGIHVYNRDGLQRGVDPFEFYPRLGVDQDASHAFYLGVELARAQIAWQLGKRYYQDRELDWGCATRPSPEPEDLEVKGSEDA